MAELTAQEEVDGNFEAFQELFPQLMATVPGKFVVLHDRKISESFDTFPDAIRFGRRTYGWGRFSVQEVTDRRITQGFRSYAVPERPH